MDKLYYFAVTEATLTVVGFCMYHMIEIQLTVSWSTLHSYSYFDVVVGLAWPNDPESYASSGIATGRASHARYVKGDDPD